MNVEVSGLEVDWNQSGSAWMMFFSYPSQVRGGRGTGENKEKFG